MADLTFTFNLVRWNFDTLASLKNHQTLYVEGCRLHAEDRFFAFFRRESCCRSRILRCLEDTLCLMEEILSSYEHSTYLQRNYLPAQEQMEVARSMFTKCEEWLVKREAVINGLSILKKFQRYIDDAKFTTSLNALIQRLNRLFTKVKTVIQQYQDMLNFQQHNRLAELIQSPISRSPKVIIGSPASMPELQPLDATSQRREFSL